MEITEFLNKVRGIVAYPNKHNDLPSEEEFNKFLESMLDASRKTNGTVLYVDIEPDVAIYLYEHYMIDALPQVGYLNTFATEAYKTFLEIFSYQSVNGLGSANIYDNLTIPFALSHGEITAHIVIVNAYNNNKVGRYGVNFRIDWETRKYKARLIFQGNDKFNAPTA